MAEGAYKRAAGAEKFGLTTHKYTIFARVSAHTTQLSLPPSHFTAAQGTFTVKPPVRYPSALTCTETLPEPQRRFREIACAKVSPLGPAEPTPVRQAAARKRKQRPPDALCGRSAHFDRPSPLVQMAGITHGEGCGSPLRMSIRHTRPWHVRW
jgi:hypothetical protein